MSRYIDADAIKDKAWKVESEACFYALEDVVSVTDIDEAPSIDIVRCKDCRWLDKGENESCSWSMCTRHFGQYINVNAEDFCSYGEVRDE